MQNQGRSGPDHQEECYTLNVFAPLQINLLKSNPKGDVLAGGAFGRDWVMRVEPSYMALVSLYKRFQRAPLSLLPREDAVRRPQAVSQEVGPHQIPN